MPDPDKIETPPLEITIRRSNRDQQFAKDITREGQLPGGTEVRDETGARGDVGDTFMVQRQQQEAQDLERWMRGQAAPPSTGAAAPPPADATVAAPPPGSGGAAAPPADGVPSPDDLAAHGFGTKLPTGGEIARAAGKVGAEIVRTPRAVAAGVGAAGKELFNATDSLATWLNDNVADLTIPIPKTGSDTVDAALANPAKAIADLIPQPATPNTATGPMVKAVSQFIAGMVLGGKLFKGIGALAEGVGGAAGAATKGVAAGAVSDALFHDPNDANLSALLKDVPGLKVIVPEFLATKPGDNEALNRLRKGVEGLGLGAAAEGLLRALQVYRANRAARTAVGDAVDPLAAERVAYGELKEADLAAKVGDFSAEAKLVSFNERGGPSAAELAAAADDPAKLAALKAEAKPGKGDLPGGRIAINWARIATADDVKAVMREMADHFKETIGKARREKMSVEETARLADELGLTVEQLLARREGEAWNAETTLAARRMLTMATEKLMEASRAAASPNAGPVDLYAFRRMLATQAAIQNEVLAARAEAGRALNAWKIPAAAKGDVERSRAVLEALESGGGEEMARELARRINVLADTGADSAGVNAVMREGWKATAWNAVAEVWVNALLSSPRTHLVNISSNTLALGQQVLERGLAEKFAAALRAEGGDVAGIAPGEAAAMIHALIFAQKEAWKTSWLALRSGETGHALGKVDLTHEAAVSAEKFRLEGTQLGQVVDYLGTAERVPGRLLGSEDEYFKTIGYRMELAAQAQRQAVSEGLSGPALRDRFAELMASPPEHIHMAAVDAALYATFTSRAGDAAKAFIKLREAWPAAVFIIPFVKTPINIMRYGFERTPLAPLMSSFRADVAAGGARAELALARMATGTSIMLMAADYADRGLVSGRGPSEPGKREALERQGWKPYAIRSGDKWITYDRLDPFGMLLGFAADMAEYANRFEIDGDKLDEFSEIWAAGIAAVSQTTVNKSYMQGIGDFVWMVEDPKRRAYDYAGRLAGSVVPAGVNMVKQLGDPVAREHMKIWDYVQGRLPGFAQGLIPALDFWGKEKQPDPENGVWFNALSPVQVSRVRPSPIDAELGRLNIGPEKIDKRSAFMGAQMNFRDWPEVYDRYVVLAGNEFKNPAWGGKGTKDYLDELVQGKGPLGQRYKTLTDGPQGGKAELINGVIATGRKLAQVAILADPKFGAFKDAWRQQLDSQNAQKAPLQGVTPPATPNVPIPMPPGGRPAAPAPSISPMRAP